MTEQKNYLCITPTGDGWRNLAIDEYLLDSLQSGELCLLFYINDNAVILGRNQNPWAECNLEAMNADGVQLVRRCTGGGAVYHDGGNLNYSFVAHGSRYDEKRQTALILRALARFGINADATGRNDLTVDGKKVSGNAFCKRGQNRIRHGTLLVNANLSKLCDYLTVSPQKLQAKGVQSVRSRVCNLIDVCPALTVPALMDAIRDEYEREYGVYESFDPNNARDGIETLYERNRSWAWQIGKAPAFNYTLEDRFGFGMARLCVNIKDGLIREATLYTDALDTELPARVEAELIGTAFDPQELRVVLETI